MHTPPSHLIESQEHVPMWARTHALPSVERMQLWGRGALYDAFYPQRTPRWKEVDAHVLARLRKHGLDQDGEHAVRENFGAGDMETLTRTGVSAVQNAGVMGVMTLPLADPGPVNACPFVGNFDGWNPAMAALDLEYVTPDGVQRINERGRAMHVETAHGKEHSFAGIALRRFKMEMLAAEYAELLRRGAPERQAVEEYVECPPPRILDHVLTQLLTERFGKAWQEWPGEYKCHDASDILRLHPELQQQVAPLLYMQWKLDRQVRGYCSSLLEAGGYPIVVRPFGCLSAHSAVRLDWLAQRQGSKGAFLLHPDGNPAYETGVNTGLLGRVEKYGVQRWQGVAYSAHPEAVSFVVDTLRPIAEASSGKGGVMMDHWLGLFYKRCQFRWDDPHDPGEYQDAWGEELLAAIRAEFPELALFGEDVGFEDPSVDAARRRMGMPGVDAPYFATQPGHPINWDHIHVERVPRDKIIMVSADHNAEAPQDWFDGLPHDQREALGRHYFADWEQRRSFDYWQFAGRVADCPQGLVTVTGRDLAGDRRRDNIPGVPDTSDNRLWQFTSPLTHEEELRLQGGPLAELLQRTRRRVQSAVEGLPLALSMVPRAGEVVRARPGGTVTVRLALTDHPAVQRMRLVLESTLTGGSLPLSHLTYRRYASDRLLVCEASVRVPETAGPGAYELWGRFEGDDGSGQSLCDYGNNIIVHVMP